MSKPRPLRGPLRKRKSHLWDRHPEDWYVEPDWANERLFEAEPFEGAILDPACGIGRIVKAARKAGLKCAGADLIRRAPGFRVGDFFQTTRSVANVVSNPPFRFAMAFVGHSLNLASNKVALLLPAGWVQSDERSRWLARTPLRRIWLLTPRPAMPPGTMVGASRGNGTTDFAWLVWEQGYQGRPEISWLRRQSA